MCPVLMIYSSLSRAGMEFSSEVGRSTFFLLLLPFISVPSLPNSLGNFFLQVHKRTPAFLCSLSAQKKNRKVASVFFFASVHLFSGFLLPPFFRRPPSCFLPPLLCCCNSEHEGAESAGLDTAAEYSAASCSAFLLILLLAISLGSHLQLPSSSSALPRSSRHRRRAPLSLRVSPLMALHITLNHHNNKSTLTRRQTAVPRGALRNIPR